MEAYTIASDDEVFIFGTKGSFGSVRRSDDELFHRRVAERSRDGEVSVDSLIHDESSGLIDSLCLLCVASFVVMGKSNSLTISARAA